MKELTSKSHEKAVGPGICVDPGPHCFSLTDKPDSVDVKIGRSFLLEYDFSYSPAAYPQRLYRAEHSRCLFGLALTGACRARVVTNSAGSSYLSFSPLPTAIGQAIGGTFSVALSIASENDAPRSYLAVCSVVSGLSSKGNPPRSSDQRKA